MKRLDSLWSTMNQRNEERKKLIKSTLSKRYAGRTLREKADKVREELEGTRFDAFRERELLVHKSLFDDLIHEEEVELDKNMKAL